MSAGSRRRDALGKLARTGAEIAPAHHLTLAGGNSHPAIRERRRERIDASSMSASLKAPEE